jgi:predicted amidophosphoribosyltransferase
VNWFFEFWLPVNCLLCGKPPRQLCESCIGQTLPTPRAVSRSGLVPGTAAVDYQGRAKDLVRHLKVLGSGTVAKIMAQKMAESSCGFALSGLLASSEFQASGSSSRPVSIFLVPVPSRKEITRIRGFVPAELLAKKLANELRNQGLPVEFKPLVRLTRVVQDQAGLSRQARDQNLVGAMKAIAPSIDANRQIWMVDDVITTGASLRELQRSLISAGWNVQRFVTFAETL